MIPYLAKHFEVLESQNPLIDKLQSARSTNQQILRVQYYKMFGWVVMVHEIHILILLPLNIKLPDRPFHNFFGLELRSIL